MTLRPSRSRIRRFFVGIGVSMATGVILALLGPFGTFGAVGIGKRLVYWVGLLVGGYVIYAPVTVGGMALARSLRLPAAGMIVSCAMLASLAMTMVVWRTNEIVSEFDNGPASMPTVEQFFMLYGYVLLIGLFMTAQLWWSASRNERAEAAERHEPERLLSPQEDLSPQEETPADAETGPAFLQRLPAGHDGTIYALESEDHYVRVHGDGRSDLILMRLADAISEMDGVDGLQVHRSWWVARDAFMDMKRNGRSAMLTLPGNLVAPVSRGNMAALKAAGWE